MITVIRRYTKSGSKALLWVMFAAFIIGLMPLAVRQASNNQWAIRVNGQDIGYRDFVHEVEKQKQRIMAFRMQYGEYADWLLTTMKMNDPKSMAFRTLTRNELINQFADSAGIHLSPEYIVDRMNNPQFVQEELAHIIPPQIVNSMGGINHTQLQQYLKYNRIPTEVFERQIERALVEKVAMDLLRSTFYLPEFDVKQKYTTDYARKNFSLLEFSKKSLAAQNKEKPTEDQLSQFYDEQNKQFKRYWVSEKRDGKMWSFDPKNYHIAISDDQVEQYYEQNKVKEFIDQPATVQVRRILFKVPNESMRASVQDRIGRLRDEILPNPSKFADFAREQSEDKESAQNGGLLPAFTKGAHEDIFDRTAFLMKTDGEISSVIETSDGYEMLQRVSKNNQTFKPFSAVKASIKDMLTQQQFKNLFTQDMKRVIQQDAANENHESLMAFIKEKGGKSIEQSGKNAQEAPQLFEIKQRGDVLFFVEDGAGVAIQLTQIHERYLPAFETIKGAVLDDYLDHRAQELLEQKLQEAKKAADGQMSFKELQKSLGGSISQTGWIVSSDSEAVATFKEKGLPINEMLQLEKSGATSTHISNDRGFLVRLDEIAAFDSEDFNQKKNEISEALEQERMQQYIDGFVASLHRNAKIETNESVVTPQE